MEKEIASFYLFIYFMVGERILGGFSIFQAVPGEAPRPLQAPQSSRLRGKLPESEGREQQPLAEYLAQAPRRLVDLFPAVLVLFVEVEYHERCVDLPHSHLIGCPGTFR